MTKRLFQQILLLPALLLCLGSISSAQGIPSVNLENEVVQRFMAHGPYSGFGTQASYFDDREEFPSRFAWDKPVSVDLAWSGDEDGTYTLILSESRTATRRGKVILSEKVTGTRYRLTNLIPQRYYTYKVRKGLKVALKGKVRTEGQVRMLDIRDCVNARDLGGWTTLDGRTVRYGLLFRTATAAAATRTTRRRKARSATRPVTRSPKNP